MPVYFLKLFSILLVGAMMLCAAACTGAEDSIKTVSAKSENYSEAITPRPSPTSQHDAVAQKKQTAYFAGGCFWGVEAVFEHVQGVSDVTSGFSFGKVKTSNNETGEADKKGSAEAVKITYDPSKISYEQLLKIFFLVAHDPTELDRQGPDVGAQYRSAIFYISDEQKRLAEKYIAELTDAKTFERPIVTQLAAFDTFQQASDEHQNYMARHADDEYIVTNDKPKLENLRRQFPDLYVSK